LTPKKEHLSNKYKRTYIYIYWKNKKQMGKKTKKYLWKKTIRKEKKLGKKPKKKTL